MYRVFEISYYMHVEITLILYFIVLLVRVNCSQCIKHTLTKVRWHDPWAYIGIEAWRYTIVLIMSRAVQEIERNSKSAKNDNTAFAEIILRYIYFTVEYNNMCGVLVPRGLITTAKATLCTGQYSLCVLRIRNIPCNIITTMHEIRSWGHNLYIYKHNSRYTIIYIYNR